MKFFFDAKGQNFHAKAQRRKNKGRRTTGGNSIAAVCGFARAVVRNGAANLSIFRQRFDFFNNLVIFSFLGFWS